MNKNNFKVLFICTGNSCRSPMAEGILKKILLENGITHITVESAGTMAPYNLSPTNYAIITTVERGVNISAHRSTVLTKPMIDDADLILVMEKAHKRFIQNLVDNTEKKVFLLKEFGQNTTNGEEIEDPIGMDLDYYRSCYDTLEHEIRRILPLILKKAEGSQ